MRSPNVQWGVQKNGWPDGQPCSIQAAIRAVKNQRRTTSAELAPNPLTVRANVPIDLPGVPKVDARNADFQQSAFVKPYDGFVYEYGTPSGRHGGFMHPWTSGQYLDFAATTWDHYNVIQFRTNLNGLQMAATDQADRPDPAITGESRCVGTELPRGEVVPTE